MSDRIRSLIVTLRSDLRDDDAEPTINAIRMIKGVVAVSAEVADVNHHHAKMQVRADLQDKLNDAINGVLHD